MRLLERNLKTIAYRNVISSEDILNEHGYRTGEKKVVYGDPIYVKANVSEEKTSVMTKIDIDTFGILDNYDRYIMIADPHIKLDESTIFYIDTTDVEGKHDYVVKRVSRSLNQCRIMLTKVTVS